MFSDENESKSRLAYYKFNILLKYLLEINLLD